jgi:molybdopterin molybdotransferase
MNKSTLLSDTAGIILAGGASSRFGSNKALAEFRGQTLIEHEVDIFNNIFQERLLVTNTAAEYKFLNWPSVSDIFIDCGPLAGIHAGLKNISSSQAFVAACDMPLLDVRLIQFLCRLSGDWDVALPWLDNGPEPLYAVYRQSALPVIARNLAKGQRKISRMLADLKIRKVEYHELQSVISDFTTFHNINRPADLKAISSFISLDKARKIISRKLKPVAEEIIPVNAALGRVAVCSLRTETPVPHFPQSRMDGFAVRRDDIPESGKKMVSLKISTEIAAGCTDIPTIAKGEAARIMTGAHLPGGGSLVIPLEECRENNGQVRIKPGITRKKYIKKIGSDIRAGNIIAEKGREITPDHLHRLAAGGLQKIPVYCQVKVAFISTGSELVESEPCPGQTISANRILLDALVQQSGAIPLDLGLVKDRTGEINSALSHAFSSSVQMVITTGGMGPGKFDLVRQCLEMNGVDIICQGINIRPGSTTLCGLKDNIVVFSLPGPPPAVQTLFYELVRPALWKLQGRKYYSPGLLKAELGAEILINKKGLFNLKGGWLERKAGSFVVQPRGRGVDVNSIIHIPANRRLVRRGEQVTVLSFSGIMV